MKDLKLLIERYSHKYIFRGVSKNEYKMIPTLYRFDDSKDIDNYFSEYVTDAVNKFNRIVGNDYFQCLQFLQHYGAKTNLLDFTSDFLVALYFACCSNYDCDGKVYILDVDKYEHYCEEKDSAINKHITSKNISDFLKEYSETGKWKVNGIKIDLPVIVKPTLHFDRLMSQSGSFLMWGSETDNLEEMLDEVNKKEKIYSEIIIKKELKKDILEMLDKEYHININTLMMKTEYIEQMFKELYKEKNYIDYKN